MTYQIGVSRDVVGFPPWFAERGQSPMQKAWHTFHCNTWSIRAFAIMALEASEVT